MRKLKTSAIRFLALLSVAAVLGVPRPGRTQTDDSVLFTTIVPPNVLLLLDNSGSMNHLMWHPAYDDTATPTCTQWTDTSTYYASDENDSDEVLIGSNTFCGNTRTVFSDPGTSSSTRWSGRYLNWYFSDAADAYANEIIDTANGTTSDCLGSVTTFGKYRRTRIVALRQVMREVTCLINEGRGVSDGIRFGIAQFRDESDPHGGFVSERIDDNTTTHMDAVEADIQALEADAWTPLGESLFHSYLYFMSRSGTSTDRPLGVDGSTRFPAYTFQESDGEVDSADAPPSPVQYPCQKSFVIVVTDGEPTKDDFDTTASNLDVGFSIFDPELIGDYIAGDETEEVGNGDETAWYMDDIAKFMHDTDFRPDMDDDQVIDVYTVGFTTSTVANDFLDRVADAGNGLFFPADDAEELSTSLLGVLTDIVEKTTSFTASTVPASRTTDGADFYTSFFLPFGADPFWQGHLQAYHITAGGDIEDSNGDCALVDPTVGECNSGAFLSTAVPFWDAGSQIPAPASRTLYTSVLSGTPAAPTRTDFNSSLTSADLGLLSFAADGNAATAAPNRTYGGTRALNEEGLADEIVQYERGCEFGTGVQTADESGGGVACTTRSWRLADIFHSNPIVVGRPGAFILDPSYLTFKSTYATRDRVIYAGSNGGFTHGFHAGDWDASATPTPKYDEGTGVELFGFMPAWVRDSIKYQPEPNATSEHYYVDGSPDAADVWHYATATQATKASDGSEWHTMLVGGLRQGGETYYALDVTNPAASTYPALLWEFPVEGDATYTADMGETWGVPVMTRIKVKVGSDDHGGAGYERWVVIVTAGYDETGDPNLGTFVATGTKGRAIFVLDATTGEVLAMESLVGRSDSSVTAATESYAIASTPSVLDTNFDGYADLVYIGDLGGNVWKWVIHDIAEDRVNDGSGLVTQPSWTFRKFFEAPETVDGAATYYKSIFYPPSATLYRNKLYIAFGTGERTDLGFEGPTATTDDNNRFYVITDPDPYEQLGTPLAVVAESDLTDVTSDASCQSITTRGFYFIVENGEKFVTNSEIFARDVIVASFTPTDLTDPCESGGGQTSLYVFDVVCSEGFFDDGGNPTRELNLGAGFPTDPRISAGPDGRDNVVFIEKSRAEVESIFHDDINAAGSLLYWRELP